MLTNVSTKDDPSILRNGLVSVVILLTMSALAGWLGFVIARRLSAPIVELTRAADRIEVCCNSILIRQKPDRLKSHDDYTIFVNPYVSVLFLYIETENADSKINKAALSKTIGYGFEYVKVFIRSWALKK